MFLKLSLLIAILLSSLTSYSKPKEIKNIRSYSVDFGGMINTNYEVFDIPDEGLRCVKEIGRVTLSCVPLSQVLSTK